VDYVQTLKQGTSGDFDLGPVIWPRQLDVIERHVKDAVAHGARVLTGGARNQALGELFYQPTVLTDVSPDMQVMREETFGPVLSIVRVHDEAEAIRLANDTPYGLAATIWTRDSHKALELGRQIEAGHICMNDTSMTYGIHEAPFGGRKQSGLGQVHGPNGLKSYCYAQSIVLERFKLRQEDAWYPYTQEKANGMRKAMRWLFGSKLGRMLT
jgi:acyl-CoA reductase-like NAD-dependent aldehyde dehydrogenase